MTAGGRILRSIHVIILISKDRIASQLLQISSVIRRGNTKNFVLTAMRKEKFWVNSEIAGKQARKGRSKCFERPFLVSNFRF